MKTQSNMLFVIAASAVALLFTSSACVPTVPGQPGNSNGDMPPMMPPTDDMPNDNDMNNNGMNDGDPNGSLILEFTQRTIDDTILRGQSVKTSDIDNDGDTDIVVASSLLDAVILYINSGDGQSFTRVNVSGNGQLVAADIAISDFDGDGDRDIAAVNQFTRASGANSAGSVILFRNPGTPTGVWTFEPLTETNISSPTVITTADLTGDGRDEIIVGTGGGTGSVSGLFYLLNLGTTFDIPISIDDGIGNVTALLAHDVDSDTVTDLIAVDRSGNEISWYKNFRTPGETAVPAFSDFLIASITAPNDIAIGQFDNDSALELLVTTADATGGLILLYDPPANPMASWTQSIVDSGFGVGQNSRVVAADFNQDGATDIAAVSNELGVLQLYTASRNGFTQSVPIELIGVFDIATANITADTRQDLITTTVDGGTFDTVTLFQNAP